MAGAITGADGLSAFHFKDNYVEVDKTGGPWQVSHPDSTLLLSGFARASAEPDSLASLQLIGAANTVSIMEQQTVQPVKELGSSRYIMTTSNSPVTIQMNSLLISGPNLLKSLYRVATKNGLATVAGLDGVTDILQDGSLNASQVTGYGGWANLDYPWFSIPFGLAIVSRSITGVDIQSVYAEVCLIQQWAYRIQSGQTSIFTDVTIIADRVLPIRFDSSTLTTAPASNTEFSTATFSESG